MVRCAVTRVARRAALGLVLIGTVAVGLQLATVPPAPSPRPSISLSAELTSLFDPHAIARPLLAVVGASFSAGVGASSPRRAWPEDLANILGWRLALAADPGAGYVNPGSGDRGPFSKLLARLHLAGRDPAIVIVQGGHDDIGWPTALVKSRVESLLRTIMAEAPDARIGILSVFGRAHRVTRRALATNRAIIDAARFVDPSVMIFDPLRAHWRFPRHRGHLHPTTAGDRWIAERLARELWRDGALGAQGYGGPLALSA